jgi:cyclic dehypoxanthinyl futalosine synthase
MANTQDLLQKALRLEFLSQEEGIYLFENAALTELMFVADELRKKQAIKLLGLLIVI